MKKFVSMVALAAGLAAQPALAKDEPVAAPMVMGECGYQQDAPIFGVGLPAGTDPVPILIPLEKKIVERGDQSDKLRFFQVPATNIDGWTIDYAMMRLSQSAGKQMWAETQTGDPGQKISMEMPATTLAAAFDRLAAERGLRWRFDGEKVYILGGREWTIPMPSSRDLSLAIKDALSKNQINASTDGGVIRFQADDEGAARVGLIIQQVYQQERLNPYDVQFYNVYPTRGAIDWSTLVERTDSVEAVSFDGKGATLVLDPTAGSVIDAFLAREGEIRSLGATTMVSAQTNLGTTHVAGCGASASSSRGLELAGGAYERGQVPLRYSVLGGSEQQAGTMAVTPGSVVVIADGEPVEGAYMVAVVRPRVIELQGAPAGMVKVINHVAETNEPAIKDEQVVFENTFRAAVPSATVIETADEGSGQMAANGEPRSMEAAKDALRDIRPR